MKGKKMVARRERRQKVWDSCKFPEGAKRPGSNKKPFPKGN